MGVLKIFNFLMLAFLRVRSAFTPFSVDLNKVLVMMLIGGKRIILKIIAVAGLGFL